MSLRDPNRAGQSFEVDDAVRRVLKAWSKERDSQVGLLNLKRAVSKLTEPQRLQLIERLAEISLGQLYVLQKSLEEDASA